MQCSLRHTRLTLITQRVGDSLLRDRPRMLWLPSFFKVWGKRGMHGTFHQFQQYLLRSLSADDAAHRISRRLAFSHSTIKGIKSEIDAFEHILQNLRWDLTQVRSNFFAAGQFRTLSFIGENDACHAKGAFAFIERRVVDLTAQTKPPLKPVHLLVSRIDAELIRFSGLRIFLWLLR